MHNKPKPTTSHQAYPKTKHHTNPLIMSYSKQAHYPESQHQQQEPKLTNNPRRTSLTSTIPDNTMIHPGCYHRLNTSSIETKSNNLYDKENTCPVVSVNLKQAKGSKKAIGPGNIQSLLEKTMNDGEKYDARRKSKTRFVSQESADMQKDPKRLLKACPLKTSYDYYTQISTLPISQCVKMDIKIPSPKRRKSISSNNKLLYDVHSSIEGLPGTLNQRLEQDDMLNKSRGDSMAKRCALTTEETINFMRRSSVHLDPTRAGSRLMNSRISIAEYLGTGTGGAFHLENELGLTNETMTTTKKKNRSLSITQIKSHSNVMKPWEIKQRNLESSFDEYTGPKTNMNKSGKLRDLFKSSFEIR